MNRKQFLGFAGKLHKMALQLEADAKRVRVSSHPPSPYADTIKDIAGLIDALAKDIEKEFG